MTIPNTVTAKAVLAAAKVARAEKVVKVAATTIKPRHADIV